MNFRLERPAAVIMRRAGYRFPAIEKARGSRHCPQRADDEAAKPHYRHGAFVSVGGP
jgi:hypothetical protein